MVVATEAMLLTAAPALAGAPNWECRAGRAVYAFDQHDGRVHVRRGGRLRVAPLHVTEQDGLLTEFSFAIEDLAYTAKAHERTFALSDGSSAASGDCVFVAGNQAPFALSRDVTIYERMSTSSRVVATARRGAFVWHAARYGGATVVGPRRWLESTYVRDGRAVTGFLPIAASDVWTATQH